MNGRPCARITLLGAVVALALGVLAVPAHAAGLSPAAADCNAHGQLTKTYSVAQLRAALATLPADLAEYSNCHDVIQRALLAEVKGLHPGTGSGGGSFLPTWLLIVLIVLVLGGVGFAVAAVRRRDGGDVPPPPAAG
jgi:hypothetical protein